MRVDLSAWQIDEANFPADGTCAEKLRFLVAYAVLAPSGHNTQPWSFSLQGDTLALSVDTSRSLPVVDPEGREMIISCGAALRFFEIAAEHFGQDLSQEMPAEYPVLARIRLSENRLIDSAVDGKFREITRRRSNRHRFEIKPLPNSVLQDLEAAAVRCGKTLQFIAEGDPRREVASLIEKAVHIQFADGRYRTELANWMITDWSRRRDGIPGYALGLAGIASVVAPAAVRAFDLGKSRARASVEQALTAPALAVLSSSTDSKRDWLETGQAIADILLIARAADVWAAFLNETVEVPALRQRLSAMLGADTVPQLLFRLGYAADVPPVPRRSAGEVLV